MSIDENIKLGNLIDIYGDFLSDKQKNMILCYVNNDMSLAEIAENEGITRVAVLDAIKKAKQKLFEYEERLKIYKLKCSLDEAITKDDKTCKEIITKILEEF